MGNIGANIVKTTIDAALVHAEKITTKVETEVTVKTTVTQEKTVVDAALLHADKAVLDLGKLKRGTVGEAVKLFDESLEKQNSNIATEALNLTRSADKYSEFYSTWDCKGNQPKLKEFVNKMMENPIAKDNVVLNSLKNVSDKTSELSNSTAGSTFLYGAAEFIREKRADCINDIKSLNKFVENSLKIMDNYKVKSVDKNVVIRTIAETTLNSPAISNEAKALIRSGLNQSSNVTNLSDANKIILDGFKKAAEIK